MWVDTPQFSTALQAQPFESGGCAVFYVLFLSIYLEFTAGFTGFFENSVGRRSPVLNGFASSAF